MIALVSLWTADEDITLVRLIREDASATDAAKELGRSRNAVLGRAWRKNLHFKGQGGRPVVKPAQPSTRARFTDAEDKIIIALSALGQSGSQIGIAIGRSSSSVIKRACLLGANVHAKKGPPKGIKAPEVKAKKTFLHASNIAARKESRTHDPVFCHATPVVVVPRMVALVELGPSMCKFPCGDPREEAFGFCGLDTADGPYCRAHRRLCYTAPADRRRAA